MLRYHSIIALSIIMVTGVLSQVFFVPFDHHPPVTAFHTFQFTPPPSLGSTGLLPPTSTTLATTTPTITTVLVPQDRLSRILEPNILNAGSGSSGLNQAMKYYMDEQFRIGVEHIELTREQSILDGSPRSLSDPAIASRSRIVQNLEKGIQSAASRSFSEDNTFTPQTFSMDLLPQTTPSTPSSPLETSSSAAPTTPLNDLPSPAILMNPGVQSQLQDGLRNMTDVFSDLKSIFTPSHETSSLLNTIVRESPSPSEISSSTSNIPRPSSGSSPHSPIGGSRGGLNLDLGGLGSIFDFL